MTAKPLPPVTGQDAELAAVQRILLGEQYMTVYKAIKPQAEAAAVIAYHLATGKPVPTDITGGKTVNNGAGKSTLIKTIAGIFPPDGGEVRFAGQPVALRGPKDASRLGIATVYQDLALCDNLDVVANLFLGREEIDPLSRAPDEELMERRALEVLRALDVNIPVVRTPIAALSGGQRQSVAVARAVMGDAKLVLLDEPTAALVLRLGQLAGTFSTSAASREQIVAAITGADAAAVRRAG
ncbi:ATP-binding cassette domain-containing protein [Sorangium sp. So ce1097]|uniref:ATP-binding cassette domain-containing protein n=1 Tax=Sorangium sp. So ce1097 TaxID=3133330 RepID=UPI003F5DBCA0